MLERGSVYRRWLLLFFLTVFVGVASIFMGLWQKNTGATSIAQSNNSHRQLRFWYEVIAKNIPGDSKSITAWLPVPSSNRYQTIQDLNISTAYPFTIYGDAEYGNRILKVQAGSKYPESLVVRVSFTVDRRAFSAFGKSIPASSKDTRKSLLRYLSPDRLVPIDGQIKDEAARVVTGKTTDLQKAKAIYEHVTQTLTYDKSGTGWGQGDAIYACNARQGNCTDFHSLFIGMARAVGIPARFVMGFPIPKDKDTGEIPGYHCWAEFYLDKVGWIPIDASEANKHPNLQGFYFGNLDASRVEFTVGRDIVLDPKAGLEPLNYFIYPVVVADGKTLGEVTTKFRFADQKTR